MNGESFVTKLIGINLLAVLKAEEQVSESSFTRGMKEAYTDCLRTSIIHDYMEMIK